MSPIILLKFNFPIDTLKTTAAVVIFSSVGSIISRMDLRAGGTGFIA